MLVFDAAAARGRGVPVEAWERCVAALARGNAAEGVSYALAQGLRIEMTVTGPRADDYSFTGLVQAAARMFVAGYLACAADGPVAVGSMTVHGHGAVSVDLRG